MAGGARGAVVTPRVGLVDALGLVGKEMRRLLPLASTARCEVSLYGGEDEVGTLSDYDGEAMVVQALTEEGLERSDALVFCGPPEHLTQSLRFLGRGRAAVIDLGGALPLGGDTVVVVGGDDERTIAASRWFRVAHPGTALLVRLLRPLGAAFRLRRQSAVVFEPVCELGEPGVDELYRQTRDLLNFQAAPAAVLGQRVAFNLLPAWSGPRQGVERRIHDETRSALGGLGAPLAVTVLRAPLFFGTAVLLELDLPGVDAAAVRGELGRLAGVEVTAEPVSPGDLPDDEASPIWVTLVDQGQEPGLRLWAVADHVRRGAVGCALALLGRLFPAGSGPGRG